MCARACVYVCVRARERACACGGERTRLLSFAPNPEWSNAYFLGSLMLIVRKHCLLFPVVLP